MMSKENLNIDLAWHRHKRDLADLSFCDNPYEVEIIDSNLNDWLNYIEDKISNYNPSRSNIINIPKKGFHLRPGSVLKTEDAIMYQVLLLEDIDKIQKELLWSAQRHRFSNILRDDQTKSEIFFPEYKGWTNFREESQKFIEKGYDWVVFVDISGFFENISIGRLSSDLRALFVTDEVVETLRKCLYRWAEPRKRGIPQGYRCSSILAEVYLNSIDIRLKNKNINFCRYVDDIRIFCNSKTDAISSLHFLTILLREKELNVQTAKSYIKQGTAARKEIDRISELIEQCEEELSIELSDIFEFDIEYYTPTYMERLLKKSNEEEINLEVIRKVFDDYIIGYINSFDKTLFHYCIRRLGALNDDYAFDFCIKIVLERPEEFSDILLYFSKLSKKKDLIAEKLIDIFESEENVLDRHYFLLFKWIYNEKITSLKILDICRRKGFDSGMDIYTKHYAWAILGENGNIADLDAIEAEYSKVQDEISKATIIAAIRKMVKDRRNSIYDQAKNDGTLIQYAVKKYK